MMLDALKVERQGGALACAEQGVRPYCVGSWRHFNVAANLPLTGGKGITL